MKVAALAALCMLIALRAEAGERHRQDNISPSCDNNGRCTTLSVTARTSSNAPSSLGHIRTSERKPHRVVDANGNSTMVTVQTAYGSNITRCWAPRGTHVAGSNHYIGAACDIQTGWNRGPEFVYHMADIVKQAGLYNGCSFRDCGHVEAIRGTHNRAPNLYAALEKFKSEQSTANYQP